MTDFFFRTEDIRPDEVLEYFVETKLDRNILEEIKGRSPVILVGSRGVGKSFLLRAAECEMSQSFQDDRVLPVYITFNRSSLLNTSDRYQFKHWMLARICSRLLRKLNKVGLLGFNVPSFSILSGGDKPALGKKTKIEEITEKFEESYQSPGMEIDTTGVPSIDDFKDAVEDLCDALNIKRISLLFDEAAHILIPEQQRQFFTIFRDLRSPFLTCNAAVYPGVTTFGDTFQPAHDAVMLSLDRDILDEGYVDNMREIAEKQADSATINNIAKHRKYFSILAYAANGNPRTLLKTLVRASRLRSSVVNELIREYYRTDVWREHSLLSDWLSGHRELVDWGRRFIEREVLPGLKSKNDHYISSDRKTTCFFWMHRDAPEIVKQALKLLAYSGIVSEHATGIKGTRAEIGTRYSVHLGCLFSQETYPTSSALDIARQLTPKRMSEYGSNYAGYRDLTESVSKFDEPDMRSALAQQLQKNVSVLDITEWQREKLVSMGLVTLGEVLRASEHKLQEAYYVGEKRARRMRNAAIAAVFEYLSG